MCYTVSCIKVVSELVPQLDTLFNMLILVIDWFVWKFYLVSLVSNLIILVFVIWRTALVELILKYLTNLSHMLLMTNKKIYE